MMILLNLQAFKKQCLIFFSFITVASSIHAQEKIWKIDPSHSNISFTISYFNIGEIKGTFNDYSGSFHKINPVTKSSDINIVIQTASINTLQTKRDEHLKTNDFFSASEFPEISFNSTSFEQIANNNYKIVGKLTIKGITKPIVLNAIYKGSYVHPRFKNNRKFFTITGIVPREDFEIGTNYPPAKYALGNEVTLNAEVQLIQE